jgi:hypothetical protein
MEIAMKQRILNLAFNLLAVLAIAGAIVCFVQAVFTLA